MAYHARNRTTLDDPNQGTTFHELVVLPTLAPHLARPYRVPGTDIIYNTEFSSNSQGTVFFLSYDLQFTVLSAAIVRNDNTGAAETGAVSPVEPDSQDDCRAEPAPDPPAPTRGNHDLCMV